MSAHQQRFWFKKRKACQWVGLIAGAGWPRPFTPVCVSSCVTDTHTQMKMMECVSVAAVTVLAVLQQVYFSLQVIYARRRFRVSPPVTVGPPQFDRIYRAQVNCSEYFPLFITLMWISGVFLSPVVSSVCGLLYLFSRLMYFWGYSRSADRRLAPLYFSSVLLWVLLGFSTLGVLLTLTKDVRTRDD
ncbi:leukotriene C4 synthase-like [Gouania willdenowi]|uniref:leukotriene C4 synthase-like n=1 Tax=Gouania willdenowi TaxID=441366 RepID=UPI00105568C8|nr:leukotriene C4 synthase-like [Gouania willdenowi]